jgi:sec-independent protein translocase protein TatB
MNLGFMEIAGLAVLALLVFGPEKLPEAARNTGNALARLKGEATKTLDEVKQTGELDEFRGVANELRSTRDELKQAGGVTDELNQATAAVSSGAATAGAGTRVGAGSGGERPGSDALPAPPFDPDAP